MIRKLLVLVWALLLMPTTVSAQTWAVQARAEVLARAEKALNNYFFTDKIAALRAVIEANRQTLLGIDDQKAFAQTLTSELQTASGDKHLIVTYSEVPNTNQRHKASDADTAEMNRFFRYVDYGYSGSARLAGNIGYVRFGGFADLAGAKNTINAAMTLVAPTEALIVDMRGNGGGDSDTVNYLMAFLFARPVEVTTALQKTDGKIVAHRNFTPTQLGAPLFLAKPVYVLVDRSTISGGELFAYDLQSLHRATVLGEVTAGAANGLGAPPYVLSDHLSISVPDTLLRNPYTKTNWEGTGVKPDVAIDGKAALLEAYKRAVATLSTSYDPLGEIEQARKDPAAALRASLPQT